MHRFLSGKFRLLYLLALVQLVGGPLVLFQVSMLCKLTLAGAPEAGVARAAILAWHSDDFQAAMAMEDLTAPNAGKVPGSEKPEKQKITKVKDPGIPWKLAAMRHPADTDYCRIMDRERVWTPAQAQPPPGPPPRMG